MIIDLVQRAYEQLTDKLISWFDTIVRMIPNAIIACIVLFIAQRTAKLLKSLTLNVAGRLTDNLTLIRMFGGVAYYAALITGIFLTLNVLHLDKGVASLLAGAGVVGLALSFAFQDLATNFISGLFITIERPFGIGDFIESNNVLGYVERIGIRSIVIRTLDEQHVIIPSKDIFQNPLKNYNMGKERRVTISVGISYAEDLEFVAKVVKNAVRKISEVEEKRPIHVHYSEFGDSSINFELRFWIKESDQMYYLDVRSQAIIAIKKAFDKHRITIPFPIRTLNFGIKGGEKLHEALQKTHTNSNLPE